MDEKEKEFEIRRLARESLEEEQNGYIMTYIIAVTFMIAGGGFGFIYNTYFFGLSFLGLILLAFGMNSSVNTRKKIKDLGFYN